jgi:hypothetical protein
LQLSSEEKRKSYAISTDVKKLWKADPLVSFFRLRDSCPCRNAFPSPYRSVRGPSGIAGSSTVALRQRGIVADSYAGGKRKVCETINRLSHGIHSFSTSTILVQFRGSTSIFAAFFKVFFRGRPTLHKTSASLPEENFSYYGFILSGRANS